MPRLFSQESLDLRLAPPKDPAKVKRIASLVPAQLRWRTMEFRFYILVFIVVIPLMLKQGFDVSRSDHPNYPLFAPLLSDGWLFGRKVDNSDTQYRFFRDSFWLLVGLAISHIVIKRVCLTFLGVSKTLFDMVFGLVFLCAAHGFNASKILFHVLTCYGVVRGIVGLDQKHSKSGIDTHNYRKIALAFLWIYGIGALYVNDRFRDLKTFSCISERLAWMDEVRGLIPRWDVFYNFTLLRTISYNVDYLERYYALKTNIEDSRGIELKHTSVTLGIEEPTPDVAELGDRERQTYPWSIYDYSMETHLAYVFYTPLFIVGPILTFNDYLYQTRHTLNSILVERTLKYGLRFCLDMLQMEFILHFMYVVAIAKVKVFNYTPFQSLMIGLFNLNVIWLKLLIPWRFFRLWALADEMDPPENMIRCVNNNYSAMAFWRAWHRSFNKWVTRYIYVPLGGSRSRVLASLAVFSFVAVWHDIELRMLVWGWLIVLFLLPEILLSAYFKRYALEPWYRFVCGAGSVCNIWLMMIANIYGFCLGHDGTIALLKTMLGTFQGAVFFVICSGCLFVGVQVMYELRDGEKRRGIDLRC